jgi:hypothetical protein
MTTFLPRMTPIQLLGFAPAAVMIVFTAILGVGPSLNVRTFAELLWFGYLSFLKHRMQISSVSNLSTAARLPRGTRCPVR